MSDIKRLFDGWYSQSSGPKGVLLEAMDHVQTFLDLVDEKMDIEFDAIEAGDYMFDPPPFPQDKKQMEKLFAHYIHSNLGWSKKLAAGLAYEIVWGVRDYAR